MSDPLIMKSEGGRIMRDIIKIITNKGLYNGNRKKIHLKEIREEITNVVKMPTPEEMMEGAPTFEMEEDGGVTVDFTGVVEMEAEESIQEWYGDITDKLEDEEERSSIRCSR